MQLAAALGPLTFAREVLGFFPGEPQARVLRMAAAYKEIVLNCARQWGKSTIVAVLILHRMLTEAGVLVLVLAPGARQSRRMVGLVKAYLNKLEVPYGRYEGQEDSVCLENGSAIVALPAVAETIRGFSRVSMLVIDEAAFVPEDVCLALVPALSTTNGDLYVLSTPWEKRGFFYRMMTEEAKGRLQYTGRVEECLQADVEFLEREKRRPGGHFQREYLCEFLESGRFAIPAEFVRRAARPEEEAWTWL